METCGDTLYIEKTAIEVISDTDTRLNGGGIMLPHFSHSYDLGNLLTFLL